MRHILLFFAIIGMLTTGFALLDGIDYVNSENHIECSFKKGELK